MSSVEYIHTLPQQLKTVVSQAFVKSFIPTNGWLIHSPL